MMFFNHQKSALGSMNSLARGRNIGLYGSPLKIGPSEISLHVSCEKKITYIKGFHCM
jgi:hypothetical protein